MWARGLDYYGFQKFETPLFRTTWSIEVWTDRGCREQMTMVVELVMYRRTVGYDGREPRPASSRTSVCRLS